MLQARTSVEAGTILSGANPLTISPVALFLIQTCVIIVTSRLLTFPLKWLHQPSVVAEVLGGIVLGASCLSKIPAFKNNLFPAASMPLLKLVAELGLIFYLFLVGLELDPVELLKVFKKSVSISVAGIALPFALGCSIATVIYNEYADPTVSFVSFLLFMGISMSITAFPVLARILTERKLLHTKVGQATISAAAVDDFIAWALLVLVIALINNSKTGEGGAASYLTAVYVCLCIIAYALFLWYAIRPILRRLLVLSQDREHLNQLLLFVVFTLVLFSAWFTEIIGVQAIFGAFLVGVIMPHEHGFAVKLATQIEDLITIVFLPLFFAYSGLNTRLDLLDDGKSWGFVFLVCVIACAGKMIGCTLSARFSGLNWRESSAVGILMNTRGLVQIIVLNVGLHAGVITDKIFAMFVLMAIFTTFLTVPLIAVVYPYSYYSEQVNMGDIGGAEKEPTLNEINTADLLDETQLRTLVCLPSMGVVSPMMTLCTMISGSPTLSSFTVYALRLVKLDSRMTTVMQAAEQTDTIKEDAILNVFRTFSSLHGVVSHPLLNFADPNDVSEAIIDAAKHSSVNMVIIPQLAAKHSETPTTPGESTRPSKYQSAWIGEDATQSTRHIAYDVWNALSSVSVIHFIDRGFMALNSRDGTKPTSVPSAVSVFQEQAPATIESSPLSGKARGPKPGRLNTTPGPVVVNVVLIVSGLADSCEAEAVRLVQHITGSTSVSQSITFSINILKLCNEPVSQDASVASVATVDVKNANEIQMDTRNIPALTSRIDNLCRHHEDLVVVGETVLKQNAGFVVEGEKQPGLEHWLEYDCSATIAIVHGRK